MKNVLIALALVFSTTACFAQEREHRGRPQVDHKERDHGPQRYNSPHRGSQPHWQHGHHGHHRPPVGFRPTIGWFPQGFHLGIGPMTVGPDRRHVRFGISAGFYGAPRVHTFNYYGRHR